ncbi:MAG: UDP-N-acetylglucosamine 2-epimerase (non-hydrolyzing) [Rickettsiales bacterium]|nr:UDP-N-acetylglucosamine 2-epimerase (non-hydrolyzing) [Rickettsiales bacterium]
MTSETIFSIIGARPHFVKAAPFMEAMRESSHQVFTIHSGQHYDRNMSDVFFQELGIPDPDINLGIGSGTHANQTAEVMMGVEKLILEKKPEAVVVYGDTNTTLGAALAAAKLYVPLVHIEAGVRCGNYHMPEEINRGVIDKISNCLVCPSDLAVQNLAKEGIVKGVDNYGDFMYDTFVKAQEMARVQAIDLADYNVKEGGYFLSTLHREETTASAETLAAVLDALGSFDYPVLLPLHPRTRACLEQANIPLERSDNLRILEPIGYIEMVSLMSRAKMVLTDSGGVQKEALWAGIPCVTLMNETTWVETIEAGWNKLTGLDSQKIKNAVVHFLENTPPALSDVTSLYGPVGSAQRVAKNLGWI